MDHHNKVKDRFRRKKLFEYKQSNQLDNNEHIIV